MGMNSYIVATHKQWNIEAYKHFTKSLSGKWYLITEPNQLNQKFIRSILPRYIFFPHWSYRVPTEILSMTDCVCFHMTDVPYGRGGSPLQNLILNKHTETKVSALRMVDELDAGPVYMKQSMSLEGSAQDIYERTSEVIFSMIENMVETNPEPIAQFGAVKNFPRRKPEESQLLGYLEPSELYDRIRMVDADTYGKAFVIVGNMKIEFVNAIIEDNEVIARASFSLLNEENNDK